MDLFAVTSIWYFVLLILGLVFFPITKRFFYSFYDFGYPFAKTIGIILVSYSIYVLSTFRLLTFSQMSLYIILGVFTIINFKLFSKENLTKKNRVLFLIIEEVVFFCSLLFWTYIRSQEPSIRGLEKFMDFGFINSVIRGSYLPAQDIWLAGHSINYYYFGHITGGVLTKLSNIPSYITYNLILATLFALGITQSFSLVLNLIYVGLKNNFKLSLVGGILASFLVNFGGNLHTIYSFTKGYPNESPVPFWTLPAKFTLGQLLHIKTALDQLPVGYWYPNATRFIPYTIHEFPLYSYVVADLHGHVFDIPFVLLTLAVLLVILNQKKPISTHFNQFQLISTIALGFLTSIHFMTNAFDGPIYLLLSVVVLFFIFKVSSKFLISVAILVLSFVIFNIPFSINFEPFASSIGVNCAPSFLVEMKKFGPLLFEKGNCQKSPIWMMITLWGFFWFNFIFLAVKTWLYKDIKHRTSTTLSLILFAISTMIILASEFVYAKDIYPAHFRANTMFKLGYQAFIMMSIASAYTFVVFKHDFKKSFPLSLIYIILFVPLFFLVALYPTFAINSYYGGHNKALTMDGTDWILQKYPEYREIIEYLNTKVSGQPTILEAQGDSYTDFNVVSAYTGLPTIAGWSVHEWLWRGTYDVVGGIIPDVQMIYESENIQQVKELLKKYNVSYVIVGSNEKEKYKNLSVFKFEALGQPVFETSDHKGVIYKMALDRE